jgi:hypothetical protein
LYVSIARIAFARRIRLQQAIEVHEKTGPVRQLGLAADPFVTEEITLLSPSLSVTTP